MSVVGNILFSIHIEGRENIPTKEPFVIVSNHQSNWDIILLATTMNKRQMFFMGKRELIDTPVLGKALTALGVYPVNRGKGDTSAIDNSVDILKQQKVVAMFPEGTRSKDGVIRPAQSGVALIVHKAKSDVLPVSIYFKDKLRFRRKIIIRVGELIKYDEFGFSETLRSSERKNASKMIMDRIRFTHEKGYN